MIMKWLSIAISFFMLNTPIWFVGENWNYDVEIGMEKNNSKGFFEIRDLLMEVIGENEQTYQVNISGNVNGQFIIHRFIDILVRVSGSLKATFFFNKTDFSIVNGSVITQGSMTIMERKKSYYFVLNISFNPPYKTIDFPLEIRKKWVSKTNISMEGEIYVEGLVSPPEKINYSNSATTEFECVGLEKIEIKAGEYEAYHIISKNAELWYVEEVKNMAKLILQNIKIKETKFNIEMELTNYHLKKINPPKIKIIRPKRNYLYIFDREIMEIKNTIVIGDITVKAEGNENVTKVEFYFNNKSCFVDYEMPYEWKCMEPGFGWREIKCIAYDIYGNEAEDTLKVIYINE